MTTHKIDATNQSLGRLASRIASILRGKHLASFRPHLVPDIEVLVRNIEKIKFTGKKLEKRAYHRYSGYPGGLKTRLLATLWAKRPQEVFRQSVYRMLPKNRIRDRMIKNLKFQ